ncbi:S41 family peptidase [Streptomyces johnsoniae]|uniref:S41 family peptidase n=1 Tax=Streptomyces johnsoniae TaxID=3075532 RepID=A0ABU2SEK8_9ACTN|nr:S41 family peptidase [Streptomyces sp. DSM 41886]MDT0446540.1 S41 family peptidase [Streptomyces sp. DSM 41886]
MSREADAYLTTVLDLMEENALLSRRVDWPAVRAEARGPAAGARTPGDTHAAIEVALRSLGDRHSYLVRPDAAAEVLHGPLVEGAGPQGRSLPGGFAHLTLPGAPASEEGEAAYVREGRDAVREAVGGGACGWVVDLRENTGGNMWAQLAVVAGLLGDGEVGAFVHADGRRGPWVIEEGAVLVEGGVLGPAQPVLPAMPPVAVLTGSATASAGEAVAIAFRGRPDTRSFGRPTFGVPTGNALHELPDGAVLLLTEVREADRTGRVYPHDQPLRPDEETRGERATLRAATDWLASHPRCRGTASG